MYRAVLAATGPGAEVNFLLADVLYAMGDVTAARERYYAAVEIEEDFVEPRANLGCVLAELGELELAVATFRGALDCFADYADVHLHLARTLDTLGRRDEALPHWRAFLRLSPDSLWSDEAAERLR
jgi:tetratricopeptide (TPR) repeat protein